MPEEHGLQHQTDVVQFKAQFGCILWSKLLTVEPQFTHLQNRVFNIYCLGLLQMINWVAKVKCLAGTQYLSIAVDRRKMPLMSPLPAPQKKTDFNLLVSYGNHFVSLCVLAMWPSLFPFYRPMGVVRLYQRKRKQKSLNGLMNQV